MFNKQVLYSDNWTVIRPNIYPSSVVKSLFPPLDIIVSPYHSYSKLALMFTKRVWRVLRANVMLFSLLSMPTLRGDYYRK